MKKRIIDYIGFVSFFIGIFGLAGAIENGTEPFVALALFLIGTVLMIGASRNEKVNDYCSHSDSVSYKYKR